MLKKLSKTENEFHQNPEETKPNYDSQSNYHATGSINLDSMKAKLKFATFLNKYSSPVILAH